MIRINIVRDRKGIIREFSVRGHAGAGMEGEDIVCAAVSAVAYTAAGALEELAGIGGHKEKDGYMICSMPVGIPQEKEHTAAIIFEAAAIGFKQIELSYGKYVSVMDEEV